MLAKGNRPSPSISPSNARAARIPLPPVERSRFPRPYGNTSTIDVGWLYPLVVEECLPGDTITLNSTAFVRLNTLLKPFMGNLYVDTFWFFVPFRILWPNWEKLQGAQDNPGDSTDYLVPHLYDPAHNAYFNVESGHLFDYMNLALGTYRLDTYDDGLPMYISALYGRAYNKIFNDWFRDQDYQLSVYSPTDDGPDNFQNYNLLKRNMLHDMFTSSRPWAQKGPSVALPLGTWAPVVGMDQPMGLTDQYPDVPFASVNAPFLIGSGTTGTGQFPLGSGLSSAAGVIPPLGAPGYSITQPDYQNQYLGLSSDPDRSGVRTDLSSATAATINAIREAVTLQQILELDARGGTRFVERMFATWRVNTGDARLQRPEYLGGSSVRIDISAVPQTSQPTESQPLAQLAGYGTSVSHSQLHYSTVEAGILMGIWNVRGEVIYNNRLEKKWTRRSRWDFPEPLTMHIGEQPILRQELYYTNTHLGDNQEIWGYQEAWPDYRYTQRAVTGLMRPGVTDSLAVWNIALEGDDTPLHMDGAWLLDHTPVDRVIAVQDEPQFYIDVSVDSMWARMMPVYSDPGLMRF